MAARAQRAELFLRLCEQQSRVVAATIAEALAEEHRRQRVALESLLPDDAVDDDDVDEKVVAVTPLVAKELEELRTALLDERAVARGGPVVAQLVAAWEQGGGGCGGVLRGTVKGEAAEAAGGSQLGCGAQSAVPSPSGLITLAGAEVARPVEAPSSGGLQKVANPEGAGPQMAEQRQSRVDAGHELDGGGCGVQSGVQSKQGGDPGESEEAASGGGDSGYVVAAEAARGSMVGFGDQSAVPSPSGLTTLAGAEAARPVDVPSSGGSGLLQKVATTEGAEPQMTAERVQSRVDAWQELGGGGGCGMQMQSGVNEHGGDSGYVEVAEAACGSMVGFGVQSAVPSPSGLTTLSGDEVARPVEAPSSGGLQKVATSEVAELQMASELGQSRVAAGQELDGGGCGVQSDSVKEHGGGDSVESAEAAGGSLVGLGTQSAVPSPSGLTTRVVGEAARPVDAPSFGGLQKVAITAGAAPQMAAETLQSRVDAWQEMRRERKFEAADTLLMELKNAGVAVDSIALTWTGPGGAGGLIGGGLGAKGRGGGWFKRRRHDASQSGGAAADDDIDQLVVGGVVAAAESGEGGMGGGGGWCGLAPVAGWEATLAESAASKYAAEELGEGGMGGGGVEKWVASWWSADEWAKVLAETERRIAVSAADRLAAGA